MAGQGHTHGVPMPALLEAHGAIRVEIEHLVGELAASSAFEPAGEERDVDEIIARIDRVGIEARRLEGLLARRIVELEAETGSLLARLNETPDHRPRRTWASLLRPFDAGAQRHLREHQVAGGLARQFEPTHAALDLLDQHRLFLKAQLPRCEPVLDAALVRLNALADPKRRSGDDAEVETRIEALSLGIELLQDLLDRIIDMLAAANILRNKLQLDGEALVLSLSGLSGVEPALAPEPEVWFRPLFERARQRLLTVSAVTARRKRLNDVFRRRMAGSRQAGTG